MSPAEGHARARTGRRLAPAALMVATLLAGAAPAAASTTGPFETLRGGCQQAHADDLAALAYCLQEAALAVNLQVDERYVALRAGLKGDPARRLLNAQRAFVRFRDLHCTAIGRAVDPVAWQACNLRLTLDRLAQLERYPEP